MISGQQSFCDNDTLNFNPAKKEKPKSVLVILRRDFLVLLRQCLVSQKQILYCAAKLIEYYRHWRKWKVSVHRTEWIYQPLKNIYDDLMQEHSRHVIREAISLLMQLGYLERRKNPGNGQDRTYQYRLRVDRINKALSAIDSASPANESVDTIDTIEPSNESFSESLTESAFVRSEHGEFRSESGNFIVEQQTQIQSTNIKPTLIDEKKDFEEKTENKDKEEFSTSTVEIITPEKSKLTPAFDLNQDQTSAAGALQNFTISDDVEQQTLEQQVKDKLQGLFAVGTDRKSSPERQREPYRIKIEGLDEEIHEILWKHQAELTKLNVDLDSDRIRNAIADNPQFLEDAIFAFFEASAKGALTQEAATGYFYNALRNGWKPKYPNVPANQKPRYFTAPPEFFQEHKPVSLAELVERKRQSWKVAILRPSIEAWAKETPGVVITDSGPVLEDGYEG